MGKFENTNINSLQPTSIYLNPLQPTSIHFYYQLKFNLWHKKNSTYFDILQSISTHFNQPHPFTYLNLPTKITGLYSKNSNVT